MKSIEVTYDVSVRGSEVWEPGEAAFRLDFVDDDIAALVNHYKENPEDLDACWNSSCFPYDN